MVPSGTEMYYEIDDNGVKVPSQVSKNNIVYNKAKKLKEEDS